MIHRTPCPLCETPLKQLSLSTGGIRRMGCYNNRCGWEGVMSSAIRADDPIGNRTTLDIVMADPHAKAILDVAADTVKRKMDAALVAVRYCAQHCWQGR